MKQIHKNKFGWIAALEGSKAKTQLSINKLEDSFAMTTIFPSLRTVFGEVIHPN